MINVFKNKTFIKILIGVAIFICLTTALLLFYFLNQIKPAKYFSADVTTKYSQVEVIGTLNGQETLSDLTSKKGSSKSLFTELTFDCTKDISFDNLSFTIFANSECIIRISVWQDENNIVEEVSMLTKENKKIFFDGDGNFDLEVGQSIIIKITTEIPIIISNLKISK